MKILPSGLAVIEGDQCASKWIAESGRVDYDRGVDGILPYLSPGGTAIDVGAMVGGWSFAMKRAVGPTGTVHAFEPNPVAFSCLKHNCPDVVAHNCALGARAGKLCIQHDPSNPGASYLKEGDGVCVPVYTLDELSRTLGGFNSCQVLKIDVEGMEPEVIAGAMDCIERMRPWICAEVNHGALARNGYRWTDIAHPLDDLGYTSVLNNNPDLLDEKRWPQMDILFIPPQRT